MFARRPTTAGIACITGAVFFLTLQDAAIKWLSGSYPLHEIVLVRATLAAALTLIAVRLEGGLRILRSHRPGLHLARGVLLVAANSCFFLALAAMQLAEAVALFFMAPLLITALSSILLREPVGPRRWIAVTVGLAGVIVMLRPGEGVARLVAFLPVAAAAAYACMQIVTRRLGTTDQASTMAFYVQIAFIVFSAIMGLVAGDGRFAPQGNLSLEFLLRAWTVPRWADALLLVAIGSFNAIGAYLISQAYRVAEAAVVAPFEYVSLPLAVAWGWLLWGDLPDAVATLGIVLIIGSGLYALHREMVHADSHGNTADAARRGPEGADS